jgi:hypothetical protein
VGEPWSQGKNRHENNNDERKTSSELCENLRHPEVGDSTGKRSFCNRRFSWGHFAKKRSEILSTVSPRLPNIFGDNSHRKTGDFREEEEAGQSTYSKPLFAERFRAQKC